MGSRLTRQKKRRGKGLRIASNSAPAILFAFPGGKVGKNDRRNNRYAALSMGQI